jgi:hypothetical protein
MTVTKRILTTIMLILVAALAVGCRQSDSGVEAPPGANVQVIKPAVHDPNTPTLKTSSSAPGGSGNPGASTGNP